MTGTALQAISSSTPSLCGPAHRRSRRFLALTALVAVAGSLAATALIAPAEAATPFSRHAVPNSGGFSIALPADWKAFDYRQVTSSAVVKKIAAENPNLQQLLQAIRDPRSGVRFFAADPDTGGVFANNVNLVLETIPNGITAVQYGNAVINQLAGLANVVKPVRHQIVSLPAGTAVRLRYGLRFVLDGKQVQVATTQYALVRGTRAYVVTYTTLRSRLARLSPLFETSARTIRLS